MEDVPYWIDSAPIKRFPRLLKNVEVDVLVVGAGVTGITAAYLLKQGGLSVALIERECVASIDTGHTTAHLTYVTDVELRELARNFAMTTRKPPGTQERRRSTRSKESSGRKR